MLYRARLTQEPGTLERIASNVQGEDLWLNPAPVGTLVGINRQNASPSIFLLDSAQAQATARPIGQSASTQHGHVWLPDGSGVLMYGMPVSSAEGDLFWIDAADPDLVPIDLRESCDGLPQVSYALPSRWSE